MMIVNIGERFCQYFEDGLTKRFIGMDGNLYPKAKQSLNKLKTASKALSFHWFIKLAENICNVGNQIKEKCWNAYEEENPMHKIDLKEGKYIEHMVENKYVPVMPEDIYGVML